MPQLKIGSWWRAALVAVACFPGLGACIVRPTETHNVSVNRDQTRRLELGDGLRVVLEIAPAFDAAAAVLVIGAGSGDDPATMAGLGNLTFNMFCYANLGTTPYLDRAIDGTASASTSWDSTTFLTTDNPDSLEESLTFLQGILKDPLAGVDDRLFRQEWLAVSNERRWRTETGTPGEAVGWLMADTFPEGDPYAHGPVGTAESLSGLTLADARAFVAGHYRAASSTLLITAPLPLDEQQALVERVTGQSARIVTAAPAARINPRPSALQARPRSFRAHDAEVPAPTLWVGWSVPSAFATGGELGPLLAAAIRNGTRDLMDRDTDVGDVRTGLDDGVAASLLHVEVTLKKGIHPERTAELVADEAIAGLGTDFEALKRFASTEHVYDEEGLEDRALDGAWSANVLGSTAYLRGLGERMLAPSRAETTTYVDTFLGRERTHVVLVQPASVQAAYAGSPLRPASTVAGAATLEPSAPPPLSPPTSAPRPRPAWVPRAPHALLAGLETHDLENGLRVILLPRPGAGFHTVLLGFSGGRAEATPVGVGIAASWARYWREGSPRIWGVDYHTRLATDTTEEVLRSTGSDVHATLRHLARMMDFSVFWPPKRYGELVDLLEREDAAPAASFDRALDAAVFGSHPLGLWAAAKQIQKITPAEVARWNDRVRRPGNAALVIVGDIDPREALAAVEEELGSWGRNAAPSKSLPAPPLLENAALPDGQRLIVRNRPGAQQATLHFKCLLPPTTADQFAARAIFGLGLRRALVAGLREKLGATYGVGSHVGVLRGGTTVLDVSADLDYPFIPEALSRLRALLEAPDSGLTSGATFEHARALVAERSDLAIATSYQMAESLLWRWSLGWPLESMNDARDRALHTRPEEIADTLERCRDNWVVGVLGDERQMGAFRPAPPL